MGHTTLEGAVRSLSWYSWKVYLKLCKVLSKRIFPKWQLPKGTFPSCNFPNVQFPKRQLLKSVLAAALGPSQHVLVAALGPETHPNRSARPRPHCSLRRLIELSLTVGGSFCWGYCTFGKLPLGKCIWKSTQHPINYV